MNAPPPAAEHRLRLSPRPAAMVAVHYDGRRNAIIKNESSADER
jgi:hypothetical protein